MDLVPWRLGPTDSEEHRDICGVDSSVSLETITAYVRARASCACAGRSKASTSHVSS